MKLRSSFYPSRKDEHAFIAFLRPCRWFRPSYNCVYARIDNEYWRKGARSQGPTLECEHDSCCPKDPCTLAFHCQSFLRGSLIRLLLWINALQSGQQRDGPRMAAVCSQEIIPEAWRIVYIIVRYASNKNSSSFGNFRD
jgi:hypothetical protein